MIAILCYAGFAAMLVLGFIGEADEFRREGYRWVPGKHWWWGGEWRLGD